MSLRVALAGVLLASLPCLAAGAEAPASSTDATARELVELERRFADAVQRRDVAAASELMADDYALVVGIHGLPLEDTPRADWLESLKEYRIESLAIEDVRVRVHGEVAVVMLLWTQKAKLGPDGIDLDGHFVLTDTWVRRGGRWLVVDRHSSRAEAN